MTLTPEQRAAVAHRGSSLLVAASAGSGKTEVLARRCVDLLADPRRPCGVDRLLVVTFTRAAAAELRVRVAGMLRAAADQPRYRKLRDHLRRQALLVDAADIGTIDAWCGRIVREHFPAAGVDPAFSVLSEQAAALLRNEVLDELFEWIYTAADGLAAEARQWISRSTRPSDAFLRTLILELNACREHLVEPEQFFAQQLAACAGDEAEVCAASAALLAGALAEECTFQHEQLGQVLALAGPEARRELQAYRDALADWRRQLDRPERLGAVAEQVSRFRFGAGRTGPAAGADPLLQELRQRWYGKRLRQRWDSEQLGATLRHAGQTARLIVTLLRLEARFRQRLEAEKRRRAAYEFGDVLRMALELLGRPGPAGQRQPTPIARALQQRYEHILVDEYQDTSPVQVEILRLVTRRGPGRSNRFMVGDIKQSIYGFRQAEPRLFAELMRDLAAGREPGRMLPLRDSFRSHPELLAGLNRLFAMLFDPALGGTGYGQAELLQARREEIPNPTWDGRPRIELHLLEAGGGRTAPGEDRQAPLPPRRLEREALLAADAIRGLLARGAQIPARRQEGRLALRPLRLADIVVLLRSAKRNAAIVAQTLRRAGVAAVATGRESILESLEVADLRNALALLVNRRQDLPLAAYLRGPLVGLTPAELLEVRQAAPGADFPDAVERCRRCGANPLLAAKLQAALRQLDRWQAASRYTDLPGLLRQILRETGLEFFARALPGGAHRVETLRALELLAAEFCAAGGTDVAEFVQHLETLAAQELSPAASAAGAEDAVRVMTIHAAKGLEFPVVLLLNAGAQFSRQRSGAPRPAEPDCGIGLRFADGLARSELTSAAYHVIAARTAQRELEEELRLLYVAATRAREWLLVAGHCQPGLWQIWQERYGGRGAPPLIARLNARSMLEWLMLAAAGSGLGAPQAAGRPLLRLVRHESDAIGAAPSERPDQPPTAPRDRADEQWLRTARTLLEAEPDRRLARLPAAMAVSALKELAARSQAEDVPHCLERPGAHLAPPCFARGGTGADGRALGAAVHRFLQRADLRLLGSARQVRRQIAEMTSAGWLTGDQAALLPVADLVWFGGTGPARLLAEHADRCARELPFVYALPLAGTRERVIVRGVIDCLLELDEGLALFDYKTDRLSGLAGREARLAGYGTQVQLYAVAAGEIFGRAVAQAALILLCERRVVAVPPARPALESLLGGGPGDAGGAAT